MTISDFSTASGSDNFLDRGGWASIRVTENSETIDFRNNNIHIGGDWFVYCQHTNNPINEIVNLENNYWGGADSTAIAEGIHDFIDDPDAGATVDFIPFSTVPLETERMSIGDVKRLFR